MTAARAGAALAAHDVIKTYGGVTALAGVDLTLRRGEIHALVGENGAGKSTLVKVLCGITRPDRGSVTVDGRPVTFATARDAAARGIAFVAQELSVFPDLTVRENITVTNQRVDTDALTVFAGLGLQVDLEQRVEELTLADQQLLEIGRALLQDPGVLVLDEPTSAQSRAAVRRLDVVLRALAADGLAILYISHFLEEVMRIADRVTVMRDSRIALADAAADEVDLDRLVAAMIGAAIPAGSTRPTLATDDREARQLRLVDVHVGELLSGVSLSVSPGEIVGVAGLQGAGHETVLDLVCGRARPTAGQVLLPGGVQPRSVRHAYRHGVGFVPRDRKGRGLSLDQAVWENVVAARWLGLGRGGVWQRTRQHRATAEDYVDRLRIRGTADTRVGDLSGGNQQKVVFAKWMAAKPRVVVLDDPTRGVDIRARAEMHDVVRSLAAEGKVLLVASSDLAELTELCDRVAVFQHRRVVATLAGSDLDQRHLSTAMNAGFTVR